MKIRQAKKIYLQSPDVRYSMGKLNAAMDRLVNASERRLGKPGGVKFVLSMFKRRHFP